MRQKHTPVRYIDQLHKLHQKLGSTRCGIEDFDPEVAMLLDQVEQKLSNVTHLINRHGPERERLLKTIDLMQPNPFYERWIAEIKEVDNV